MNEPLFDIKVVEPQSLPCIKNRPSSMHSRSKTIQRQNDPKTTMTRKQSLKDVDVKVAQPESSKDICVNEIKLTKILIDRPAPLLSA